MTKRIYLLDPDGDLRPMEETAYDSEDLLQGLLETHSDLLAGEQMSESAPRRWLLVSREFGVPSEEGGGDRWSIDHLFIDHEAVPTLVEVKRSSDTRIRREVVGQMLDYAANALAYWPADKIRAKFEEAARGSETSAEDQLASLLEMEPIDQEAIEAFWARVKTHLQAGKVRLLFVADEIPPELRRIVEFLNGQMDPAEVYAVEVQQFVGGQQKVLVPSLLGQTAVAQSRKGATDGKQWTRETFLEALKASRGAEVAELARGLLIWITPLVDRVWFGTGARGSMVPVIDIGGGSRRGGLNAHFFALWTDGSVEMYFQYLKTKPGFESDDKRLEMLRRLNQIPGWDLPSDSISRRPSAPLETLLDAEALSSFRETIEWSIGEVRTAVIPQPE